VNFAALVVLGQVVESGSFSAAALHLGVSQSAVSRKIATLEEELGVVLLHRGRFGACLTPVGERLLPHIQGMLDLQQKIAHEVNVARGLHAGQIRIASFRSAATHILPPHIAYFRQRYPQVEISLIEADPNSVEALLKASQVDLGLVPLPRSADLETWEIAQDEFIVLLPPTEQRVPPHLTWEMLATYSFILYNDAEWTTAVRDHWANAGQTLKVAYEIKEDSTIVSMVAQGLGAAILPKLAALPIPPNLVQRSLPVPLKRRIGVAIVADRLQPPVVFAFLDLLRQVGQFGGAA
jgi:DNA-binding transcriptional LysR family regulator